MFILSLLLNNSTKRFVFLLSNTDNNKNSKKK